MPNSLLRPKYFWRLLLVLGLVWLGGKIGRLYQSAQFPVDSVLVLGGSIRREIIVAESIAQDSRIPVLVSHGSQAPCIRAIFDRAQAPVEDIWLENCAQSTFDNYRYSVSTLKRWGSRHVRVVTSPSHLPRAEWLGRLMLGSHGLWIEMQLVSETGRPGNREYRLKTIADVGRAIAWAILSQVHTPTCKELTPLTAVTLPQSEQVGVKCERQANFEQFMP